MTGPADGGACATLGVVPAPTATVSGRSPVVQPQPLALEPAEPLVLFFCLKCEDRLAREVERKDADWPWWHDCIGCGYERAVMP